MSAQSVLQFEDLLDNRHCILETDHENLTHIDVNLTRKVLRWKLYLHEKFSPDACVRNGSASVRPNATVDGAHFLIEVHNSMVSHQGLQMYKTRLNGTKTTER